MNKKEYRYIGKSMSNDQVYGKVTGSTVYCSDMQSVQMLYMKLKPAEITHGYVKNVDIEEALKVPGVKAVYHCKNTPDTCYDRGRVGAFESAPMQEQLFSEHIRFYGERVAAVVAESEEIAEKACRLIKVEYEELPVVVSVKDAMKEDAPKLHEEGNVRKVPEARYGDYESATGDYTFTSDTHIGRITHLTMETHATRAKFDKATGKLTVWAGCQTAYGIRSTLADFLGMPYSKVRVVKSPMGGSFGCRQETIVEPMAAYAAKDLKADVRLVYTREEQINNSMLKHSLDQHVETKVDADGTIKGFSMDVLMDSGAYLTVSPSYANTIGGKLGKVYDMKNIRYNADVVCTNTAVNGSFRSWGSTEATTGVENHWNHVARKLNMDPIDFRMKNILKPYGTEVMHNVSVGNVKLKECLEQGREAFEWDKKKAECKEMNKGGRYRYGVGMALCSHTSSFYPYRTDVATAEASVQDDGSVIIHVPVHDHGCGTVMAMKKIAAEVLGIDLELIQLNETDTENMGYDYGCYASRTVYSLGTAVKTSCEQLVEKMKNVAAMKLGCQLSVVQYENGELWNEIYPEVKLTMEDVWVHALEVIGVDLEAKCTTNSKVNPGTAGAHFTEVKVDTYTGRVEIVKCLSVHDVGQAINPDMCIGQIGSGIQQGIGIALCEEIKVDPVTGRTLITNLKNYEVANAAEMPDYDSILIEEGEPGGPFGAKGIGEVVVAPVAPAIVAAVNDALGTELTHLPLTPSLILDALEEMEHEN